MMAERVTVLPERLAERRDVARRLVEQEQDAETPLVGESPEGVGHEPDLFAGRAGGAPLRGGRAGSGRFHPRRPLAGRSAGWASAYRGLLGGSGRHRVLLNFIVRVGGRN